MKSSGCLALVLLFHITGALGDQDYHYCGYVWASVKFHEEVPIDGVLVTNPYKNNYRSYANFPSGLLLTDSTSGVITMAKPDVTGTFMDSTSKIIDHLAFCDLVAGANKLYSADLDGNGQDDLLCHKADGTFVARMSSNSNYKTPSLVAKNFNCPFADEIHLGDFDGNGAADILCAAADRLAYTIYFNFNSYSHFQPYNQDHDSSRKSIYDHHYNMKRHKRHTRMPTLPMAYSLVAPFPCASPSAAIIVADVNGDKRDDIVCHDAAAVSYHLSNGKPSATILAYDGAQAPILTGGCIRTATPPQIIVAADVDGDGDDDLVCLSKDVSASFPMRIAYSTGVYATQFAFETPCFASWFALIPGSPLAQFDVGDFNNDGKEDILCRFLFPGPPQAWITNIIFAEKKQ